MRPLLWVLLIGLLSCSESSQDKAPEVSVKDTSMQAQIPKTLPKPILRPAVVEVQVQLRQLEPAPQVPYETPLEKAILDRAGRCDRTPASATPNRDLLREILRFEEEFDVPPEMRGMVLAAACHESGLQPDSEGDHKCHGNKRVSTRQFRCSNGNMSRPRAIGILQQWPWWERSPWGPKIDRRDPREAARAWLAHIVNQIPKVRKPCRLWRESKRERLWVVAWVTAVRAPSKNPRCNQKPTHWHRLRRWRKTWDHLVPRPSEPFGLIMPSSVMPF